MDFIPKDRIFESNLDTLQFIRKQYNLEKSGQMKEAVQILRDWVQKQSHFTKNDFIDHYYEFIIISCKGSIERAKSRIDKMCTMRTLLPQFFGNWNVKKDFGYVYEIVYTVVMPKLTDDHCRVEILKFHDAEIKTSQFMDYFKTTIPLCEYICAHDYMNGITIILDFSQANIMNYASKLNPIELRQAMSLYIEGYGLRIKAIRLITPSKFIDIFISIAKQVLSPKVAARFHIHKTIEEIYEYIPKHVLPKDYGGDEPSLKELQMEWLEALSSEEHLEYMREINEACTDENCRQRDKFNEQCAGMPGTFRLLSVD
ncbi:unnamed protein product [Euphydryas editha]|uniref:CRAL-TRIO domain-containing protein n=1 Tax=Euphydryas editha TaxID=104508 RepID=A0AAU9U7M5_EUPED|nr:unnamed protein product [Euphydryas editha]